MTRSIDQAPLSEAAAAPLCGASRPVGAVTILSFGFKYGAPRANHTFDVSFVKNPAREERWGLWSEATDEMRTWLLEQDDARRFLEAAVPLIRVLGAADDDARVALGCSAGRHRSMILAEELARRLHAEGMTVRLVHTEEESR